MAVTLGCESGEIGDSRLGRSGEKSKGSRGREPSFLGKPRLHETDFDVAALLEVDALDKTDLTGVQGHDER